MERDQGSNLYMLPQSRYVANLMIYLSSLLSLNTYWPWAVGLSCKPSNPSSEGFRWDVGTYAWRKFKYVYKTSNEDEQSGCDFFFQGNSPRSSVDSVEFGGKRRRWKVEDSEEEREVLLLPGWEWEGKKQVTSFNSMHRFTQGRQSPWPVREGECEKVLEKGK